MEKISFDGRVALVTGAGRGIGRGYALLLGALGAKVVVNDLGGGKDGSGGDAGPAQAVANEIIAVGGTAIADSHSVADPAGAQAMVDAAIAEFGRIDIVVNNAGNVVWGGLPEADVANIEAHLDVHVKGSFNTIKAAWPHMVAQNHGRIVLTGSTGMFGLPDNLGYAIAKSSMIGMANTLTVNAGEHDIRINTVAPNAMTRLGARGDDSDAVPDVPGMGTELVSPLVAYLSHETCTASGEVYVAGAGRFGRIFVGANPGYLAADGVVPTVDDVAANWVQINDVADHYVPGSLMEWAGHFMGHRTFETEPMDNIAAPAE